MRTTITAVAAVLVAVATAGRPPKSGISPPNPENKGCNTGNKPWELKKFTSLVAFGDSYTDDSRLAYFATHNGSAPPIGWVNPAVSRSLSLYNIYSCRTDRLEELQLCKRREVLATVCCAVYRSQHLQLRRIWCRLQ